MPKKNLFFLSLLLLSSFFLLGAKAQAQSYIITEQELATLETEYQKSNQAKIEAANQLKKLGEELKASKQESTKLSINLNKEQETTASLKTFVRKLESEIISNQTAIAVVTQEKNDLAIKYEKTKGKLTACIIIICVLLLLIAGYIALKVYLRLKVPP